jgi:hypothetical protein
VLKVELIFKNKVQMTSKYEVEDGGVEECKGDEREREWKEVKPLKFLFYMYLILDISRKLCPVLILNLYNHLKNCDRMYNFQNH